VGRLAQAGAAAGPQALSLAELSQYGWGDYDSQTGLFEGYDLPPEVARRVYSTPDEHPVTWARIAQAWALVEFAFHAHLGVDLDAMRGARSWRWFVVRVRGLLTSDTALARHFAPEPDPEQETPHGR
jgi:hypothetical protein